MRFIGSGLTSLVAVVAGSSHFNDLIEVTSGKNMIELDIGLKQFTDVNSILPGEHRKPNNYQTYKDLDLTHIDEIPDVFYAQALANSPDKASHKAIIEKDIKDFRDV